MLKMDARQARQLALDLMRQHGLLDAGWTFQWSWAKRQLGLAQIRKERDPRTGKKVERKIIKLSRHLVALNEEAQVRDTILHEIAHALVGLHHGHDRVWRSVCQRIGARPQRLAGEYIAVVEPRYMVVCGRCDRPLGKRHRRLSFEQLARRYCTWCGPGSAGTLRLHDRLGT